ncbi:AraC family transcriptional regulator [Dictyobacter kobayashii]|uniref:HTH araC/xylS-type domain-containing protein n=1 Tax=Dictyobacter kobayashii TaxID=2014872 RepID=A0A402AY27_9CHLR|nr:AraC family transcriptional regulator [Dictyobacter kobayashii]GCE23977.1 hypothetical protein KDK_77770 [Dictyobacter kobayashii]
MSFQRLDYLEVWRKLPIALWHNQDCLLSYGPPTECNGITPSHMDDVYMLLLVCQGKADVLINNTCYPAPPGSLIWMSPDILHVHRAAGQLEFIFMVFAPQYIHQLWQRLLPHEQIPHVAIMPAPKIIEATMRRMVQEAMHQGMAREQLLVLLSHLLSIDTLRLFQRARHQPQHPLFTTEIIPSTEGISAPIAAALTRLRNTYTKDDIQLKQIAMEVGLSLFHFTRRFKHETSLTPGYYLRQLRLNAALHLLLGTHLPLDAIAERCGLGSARHLSDLCQSTFGQSALKLRQANEHNYILNELPAQKIVGNEQRNVL